MTADHCERCGAPWADGEGIAALCWPPGAHSYFLRHRWHSKAHRKRQERDTAKLRAWEEAAKGR